MGGGGVGGAAGLGGFFGGGVTHYVEFVYVGVSECVGTRVGGVDG